MSSVTNYVKIESVHDVMAAKSVHDVVALNTNLGARIGGASDVVRRYFGLALLPKAGLVIGLAIAARASFPDLGLILFNGMLASVVVNTLLTPPLAKYALARLGECRRQT